jgi:hypothetical protein
MAPPWSRLELTGAIGTEGPTSAWIGPEGQIYAARDLSRRTVAPARIYWRAVEPGSANIVTFDLDASSGALISVEMLVHKKEIGRRSGGLSVDQQVDGWPRCALADRAGATGAGRPGGQPSVVDAAGSIRLWIVGDWIVAQLFDDAVRRRVQFGEHLVLAIGDGERVVGLEVGRFTPEQQRQWVRMRESVLRA